MNEPSITIGNYAAASVLARSNPKGQRLTTRAIAVRAPLPVCRDLVTMLDRWATHTGVKLDPTSGFRLREVVSEGKAKNHPIGVALPEEFFRHIETLTAQTQRSRNWVACWLLEKGLAKMRLNDLTSLPQCDPSFSIVAVVAMELALADFLQSLNTHATLAANAVHATSNTARRASDVRPKSAKKPRQVKVGV